MTKAKPLPPVELVHHLLDYNKSTGLFTWQVNPAKQRIIGQRAGYLNCKGYLIISINSKEYQAHRLAWLVSTGCDPLGLQIDHINGIKHDNRFCNLRQATNSNNACNRGKSTRNASGYKGVSYSCKREKWIATIRKNGRSIYLGGYDTPELAHMAYCKAAAELHGEFARGQ